LAVAKVIETSNCPVYETATLLLSMHLIADNGDNNEIISGVLEVTAHCV
jgi:hypothetical protein